MPDDLDKPAERLRAQIHEAENRLARQTAICAELELVGGDEVRRFARALLASIHESLRTMHAKLRQIERFRETVRAHGADVNKPRGERKLKRPKKA